MFLGDIHKRNILFMCNDELFEQKKYSVILYIFMKENERNKLLNKRDLSTFVKFKKTYK